MTFSETSEKPPWTWHLYVYAKTSSGPHYIARLQSNVSQLSTLNWVTRCTFPTCKYVASYVAVDKECRRLFSCVLVSPESPLCMSHRPFPPHFSRCMWPAPIWRNTSTFDHIDLPSSFNSAFVMQGLQWVSLHRAWAVVGCCAIVEHNCDWYKLLSVIHTHLPAYSS